jgi:hypothetical protein
MQEVPASLTGKAFCRPDFHNERGSRGIQDHGGAVGLSASRTASFLHQEMGRLLEAQYDSCVHLRS